MQHGVVASCRQQPLQNTQNHFWGLQSYTQERSRRSEGQQCQASTPSSGSRHAVSTQYSEHTARTKHTPKLPAGTIATLSVDFRRAGCIIHHHCWKPTANRTKARPPSSTCTALLEESTRTHRTQTHGCGVPQSIASGSTCLKQKQAHIQTVKRPYSATRCPGRKHPA